MVKVSSSASLESQYPRVPSQLLDPSPALRFQRVGVVGVIADSRIDLWKCLGQMHGLLRGRGVSAGLDDHLHSCGPRLIHKLSGVFFAMIQVGVTIHKQGHSITMLNQIAGKSILNPREKRRPDLHNIIRRQSPPHRFTPHESIFALMWSEAVWGLLGGSRDERVENHSKKADSLSQIPERPIQSHVISG